MEALDKETIEKKGNTKIALVLIVGGLLLPIAISLIQLDFILIQLDKHIAQGLITGVSSGGTFKRPIHCPIVTFKTPDQAKHKFVSHACERRHGKPTFKNYQPVEVAYTVYRGRTLADINNFKESWFTQIFLCALSPFLIFFGIKSLPARKKPQ